MSKRGKSLGISLLMIVVFGLLLIACQAVEPAQVSAETEGAVGLAAAEDQQAAAESEVQVDETEEVRADEAASGSEAQPEEPATEMESDIQIAEEEPQLATAKASAMLSNQPGRAIVSARGNHFIVDSVPPLDGPNEELNPLDMILGAQATCALFIAERVAQEQDMLLEDAVVTVEGDLDASGVAGSGADPRIQKMRVHMSLTGPDEEQIAEIIDSYTVRCPIYTTLSRATEIEITVNDQEPGPASEGLNTAAVSAQLSNQAGRAIVSARGNHFVIDSVPPIDGPNEERNPLDLILGSLATCGTFIFERSAQEMDVPLAGLTTHVEGDLDPRGVAGVEGIDPRIQAFRVHIEAQGINDEQAAFMTEEYQERCPIYTTLIRAAPVEINVVTAD